MKKTLLIMIFLAIAGNLWAQKNKDANNPIIGIWKYTSQSAKNDFQKIMNTSPVQEYEKEYFIFEGNNKFRHVFIDHAGIVVKILKGKWKSIGEKVKIAYSDIDYSLTVDYFFLDSDLVLGQNFNHVIFTRGDLESPNFAQK